MTYLNHEMAEARDRVLPEEEWHHLLSSFASTTVEHFARGVKDLLADTAPGGMLDYIIRAQREGSLGFYMALHTGYRKVAFPEITGAFQDFRETGRWGPIEEARRQGYERACHLARRLLEILEEGRKKGTGWVEREVKGIIASIG